MWLCNPVTMSYDITDVWQCNPDITLTLTLDLNKEHNRKKKKKKRKKELNKETNVQVLYIWQVLVFKIYRYSIVFYLENQLV